MNHGKKHVKSLGRYRIMFRFGPYRFGIHKTDAQLVVASPMGIVSVLRRDKAGTR